MGAMVMVELRDAITIASEYARSIFEEKTLKNMRVEEVELSPDEKNWLITLGWDDVFEDTKTPIAGFTEVKRVYKVFFVDKQTGNVSKVKIRE